jgi:hypothetical protein
MTPRPPSFASCKNCASTEGGHTAAVGGVERDGGLRDRRYCEGVVVVVVGLEMVGGC